MFPLKKLARKGLINMAYNNKTGKIDMDWSMSSVDKLNLPVSWYDNDSDCDSWCW